MESDSCYWLVSVIDLSTHSTPSPVTVSEQSLCQFVGDMAKWSFTKIIG